MIKKSWFVVITLFFSQILFAQVGVKQGDKIGKKDRFISNGIEHIIIGTALLQVEDYGYVALPNSYHEWIQLIDGREISRTTATIDKDGFRISSASHRPGKSKHLLLIDASMIFGEGLNDEQTMAHLINLKSNIYEAYPVAFYAYGPQHHWLGFQKKILPKLIREKKGRALMFTHEGDIMRFFGAISTLSHTSKFPFVEETSPGNFAYRGNFIDSGIWWQKLVIKYCLPYDFCAGRMIRFASKEPSDEQYAIIGRLFDEIERMYREQFDVEDFKIVWVGGEPGFTKLMEHTKVKVVAFLPKSRETGESGHLKPKGMQSAVDFLFDSKLIL